MAKFKMQPTIGLGDPITARLGTTSVHYGDSEVGKFVKLTGDSRYELATAGDKIEGFIEAVEPGTADGYTIGTVNTAGRVLAVCDGSEAAGTGSIAVGDYVVAGPAEAVGTAVTTGPKVRKATNQPGDTIDVGSTVNQTNVNAALAKATDQAVNCMFAWRVVSVGVDGSVGDTCVIERVAKKVGN